MVTLKSKIKTALAYKGITQNGMSQLLGMTASNFNQKLKRESFTQDELKRIAENLDAVYTFGFEFKDGTKI